MTAKKKKIRLIVIASIAALCLLIVALGFILPGNSDFTATAGVEADFMDDSYAKYLESVQYKEGTALSSKKVNVDLQTFTAENDMKAELVNGSVKLSETGDITWTFNVEETGFYNLKFNYTTFNPETETAKDSDQSQARESLGTNASPQRAMLIDGKLLFDGMKQIDFKKKWDNGIITNKGGNEIRPTAKHINGPQEVYAADTNMRTLDPYVFKLTKGEHTITLKENREPVQINAIVFEKAPVAPTYKEYFNANSSGAVYQGDNIILQAERTNTDADGNKDESNGTTRITKTATSVGVSSDFASSNTVPYHHWNQLLNIMGGSNWATAGDAITWEFDAPADGYYQISVRARQNTNRGIKSFRRIKINGEVPFQEAKKIGFDYTSNFKNCVISDGEDPLLFYFNKGHNEITMEVVLGDFANSLSLVEDSVLELNNMYRQVVQITGTVPDTYIDYDIEKKVPAFKKSMEKQAQILSSVVEELVEITGEKGSGAIQIEKVARQCAQFAAKPDDVVDEVSDFKSNISALGTWMLDISSMPLEIDSFTISAPEAKLKSAEPNAIVAAGHETIRFFATFFTDSTKIASDTDAGGHGIKVWIATGRDQAQIIRNLVDSDYAPNHGKAVNLQLIPAGVLLPATLSGTGPDVALSEGQANVVNFAIRGALKDLKSFPDFDQFAGERFYDSAIETASYNGGVYGLPETQSFSVLFYRSDVLDELGLEVPRTWTDVEKAINVLHINNYDFYIPTAAIYPSLVFQYGGDMYKGAAGTVDEATGYKFDASGKDYGIASGLRDEPAMLAFKKLTEFFTTYNLPVSADFSNRFRTGEIPIGIADYTLFNTLEIFAPEIRGLWNFAPLPGYEDPETHEINNTVVSASNHTVMLANTKKPDDSWEFIKWWLSTEVQLQYGNTIEAILGSGARYATANKDVLKQLPWTNEQASVILEQFEHTKGVPDVPGYYMTSREIDYAFKGVVTDGQNPREALYLNVKEINDELTIKREEFHLTRYDEEGKIIND